MSEEKRDRKITVDNAGLVGPLWFIGWLFTLGLAKLAFWKAVLGLILWPYYLGAAIRMFAA